MKISIAEGRDASSNKNCYLRLLQKQYSNATIRNYGFGGFYLTDKCL